jgi:thiol-disulfide isomerase/thioredoxin
MGTCCGDSKREVPRFIKILKPVDFPMENLKIVALDKRKEKYKKSPQGEEWGLNIRRVPTFIFYKNGREINRIIETPVTTLEEDIL